MSTVTERPVAAPRPQIPHRGVPGLRLIRSEIRKISSTNAWWLFGIASLVITALSLWANMAEAAGDIAFARNPDAAIRFRPGASADDIAEAQRGSPSSTTCMPNWSRRPGRSSPPASSSGSCW